MFQLIHLSDLHFHAFPNLQKPFRSKRILGYLNLLLRRRQHYPLHRAQSLVQLLKSWNYEHLLISGDLTSLGSAQEFQIARHVLEPLLTASTHTTVLPGNHDFYLPGHTHHFHDHFGQFFEAHPIHTQKLTDQWHLIAWNSVHPNPATTAAGTVSIETLRATEAYMQKQSPRVQFLVANHYPLFFPEDYRVRSWHELHNLAYVQQWILKQPKIRMYLHGHVHHNWSLDIPRPEGDGLHVVNSASSTQYPPKANRTAFHRVVFEEDKVYVEGVSY